MRIQINNQGYQLQAMPFGGSLSPYWANRLARPIKQWLSDRGLEHCWSVDDILLLAPTKQEAEHRATELINLLTTLGMQINAEKTMKEASQNIEYIGHQFNLKQNTIKPIPEKTQNALKLVTHQLKSNVTTPKYLAAVAGTLMDVMKSNVNLQGLPQQIMRCAAQGVNYN